MYQNNEMPYGNQYGYSFGVARPLAKNTQPLTPEQIAKLRQDSSAFDMKVEVEDLWRAACTHKEKNGQSTLIQNNDGSWTCTICHETFNMCDCETKDIEAAVKTLCDMLQTSKTVYLDAPDDLITQYFQMIPLLKKFPSLWDRAMKNFAMYEGTANQGLNPMAPGYSGFAALQNLMTNPYAAYGYNNGYAAQQPAAGYGYQPQAPAYGMPMYGQQPAPVYGQPMMDPNANPMAYGVPGGIPAAPVAPAPGVMPGAAPVATAPAAAPATAEVQQQQVFNV